MKEIPLIYLWLHKRITDDAKLSMCKVIGRKQLYHRMSEIFKFPKEYAVPVLKEMENYNMIRSVNRDSIEICPLIIDPLENLSMIYLQVGVYK